MFPQEEGPLVANKAAFFWIVGSLANLITLSVAFSPETPGTVSVNKIRKPQPWVRFSTDYVRCFCNLPQCVSTGYMCKSSAGGCFSNLLEHIGHHSKDYRGRHGCLESLTNNENESTCEPDKAHKSTRKKSFTFCCYYDMCNHVDSPQTKDLINKTLVEEARENHLYRSKINSEQSSDYTNSQVWFRAATIAVPVCGAVILFVLIVLAVKILQSENEHSTRHKLRFPNCEHRMSSQSKHGCVKIEQNSFDRIANKPQHYKCFHIHGTDDLQRIHQVPLLVQNEININHGEKNETNAKLNSMRGDGLVKTCSNVALDIEKISPHYSKSNLLSSVNNDNKYVDCTYMNSVNL